MVGYSKLPYYSPAPYARWGHFVCSIAPDSSPGIEPCGQMRCAISSMSSDKENKACIHYEQKERKTPKNNKGVRWQQPYIDALPLL